MKLDQLRKIIREEVRAAVKEELQDMLNEAVKYASQPEPQPKSTNAYKPIKQKDIERKWSTGRINPGTVPLEEMLNATRQEMTPQDASNIMGGSGVQKPNFASMMTSQMAKENQGPMPGLDLNQLDFMNKAKSIFKATKEMDKKKLAV